MQCIRHMCLRPEMVVKLSMRAIGGAGKVGRERQNWERDDGIRESLAKYKPHSTIRSDEAWQSVRYRGLDEAEQALIKMAKDETMRSDPHEARAISENKLLRLEQSLLHKGFAREIKPYEPPSDAQDRVVAAFEEVTSKSAPDNLMDIELTDHYFKFKLLKLCASRFDHQVENSDLHRIKTVGDVVLYYVTPVRGISAYDQLVRDQSDLPPNLHELPEAVRFDPNDTDAFHKGIDAYPGHMNHVKGIRAREKYPPLKTKFPWPDI